MASTAFGPLVEPGWPNLPVSDLGTKFINAFALGSEINRRKQQMENQLAAMAIRERQNEMMNQYREAEFRRKLDQGEQRIMLAEQGRNLQNEIFQWKVNKDQETQEDIMGLAQGLGKIKLAPDDPNRPSAIWDVIQNNSRAAKAAPGLIKDAFGNYNSATRSRQSKWAQDYNDFLKDFKNSVGRGQFTDLNLIYNMDNWKTDPKKPGMLWAEIPTTQTGPDGQPIKTAVTLPAQKVIDLNKRLKKLDEEHANMPRQVTNEYANAQESGYSEAKPLPANKADLRVGEDYKTSRGNATWDGTQFIPKGQ